jgi:hypothetical protein
VFSGINFWARVIDSEVDVDVGSKMWNVSWSNMLVSGITQALGSAWLDSDGGNKCWLDQACFQHVV